MKTRFDRRRFIGLTTTAVAGTLFTRLPVAGTSDQTQVRAVAFDAFPIFDPRPVFALVKELFPARGSELSSLWRTRQFEYTWLRTLAGRYADFWQVTEEALMFAARSLKLELRSTERARLMNSYLNLKAWPDVPEALQTLKAAGVRLAFLSNFSRRMLEAGLKNSGLERLFEHVLTTDDVKQFKPAPRAYQMAVDAFGLKRREILFAAFAGWDVAGAKWFGYPTVWINRFNAPAEELSTAPDAMSNDLSGVVSLAISRR